MSFICENYRLLGYSWASSGILFVHWIADSLTLWKPFITPENVWTCASYYSLFARAPPGMGYVLATVITLGAAFILWSFGDGAAGNLMFDGASICMPFLIINETLLSPTNPLPFIIQSYMEPRSQFTCIRSYLVRIIPASHI